MEVICLETEAFYVIIEEVVKRLKDNDNSDKEKWIQAEEAMKILGVKSKTTLQRYRNEGLIRFAQPQRKIILYDRDSIMQYLEDHARDTF